MFCTYWVSEIYNGAKTSQLCNIPGNKHTQQNTLGAETFASRKIYEIFAFHEHKLLRIGQNSRIKLSRMDRKVEFLLLF